MNHFLDEAIDNTSKVLHELSQLKLNQSLFEPGQANKLVKSLLEPV